MSELPPGFVLDSAPSANSGLPGGFVLDEASVTPPAPAAPSEDITLDNFVRSVARGIPILGGAMDNIAAAGDAATHAVLGRGSDAPTYSERYAANLTKEQGKDAAYDDQHPYVSTAGQVAGGILGTAPLVAAAPGAFGVGAASTPARVGASIGSGAVLGGADAAVRSGGDVGEIVKGIGYGGVGGAVAPAVGAAVGKGAQAVADAVGLSRAGAAARSSAPALDDLGEQARALYQRASDAGVTVKPEAYRGFLLKLAGGLRGDGFDAALHPRSAAVIKRMAESVGDAPTLDDLEILRRLTNSAASSIEPDERRVASIIKERLDDWTENLRPQDIAAGNARDGFSAVKDARALWGQMRRGQAIEKIVEDAKLAASGYENGLRMGFRSLAKNEKQMRGFSEIEQRAIRAVAQGSPVSNVLRMLGKAAPTGIVSTVLSGAAGGAIGGAPGAVAALAGGYAARQASEALTDRAAQTAGALVRQSRGAQQAMPAISQVNRPAIDQAAEAGILGLLPAVQSIR